MKIKLNDEIQVQLINTVRKKLKFYGHESFMLNTLWLEPTEKKLIIHFIINKQMAFEGKTKKNVGKEIANFLFEKKICKKYKNSEIQFEYVLQCLQTSQNLKTSLLRLTPHEKTDPNTIRAHQVILKQNEEITTPILISMLGDFIWPELYGKRIENIYQLEPHQLQNKFQIEINLCSESKFIFNSYKELLKQVRNFLENDIIHFSQANENVVNSIEHNHHNILSFLVALHQFEFKLVQFWERYEYLLARLTIMRRVSCEIDKFFIGITSGDIEFALWEEHCIYLQTISIADQGITKFINVFCDNVEIIEEITTQLTTTLNYHQSLYEEEIYGLRQLKTHQKRNSKRESLAPSLTTSEDNCTTQVYSYAAFPPVEHTSPEKKESKELADRIIRNEERKKQLKEDKKLSSPEKSLIVEEDNIEQEMIEYHFKKNNKDFLTFTLTNDNVYVVNSKLKMYVLSEGLVSLSMPFQQVLENKEDRQFLVFNRTGKSGIKFIKNNILVIKPKSINDRMLLVCLTKNDNHFFIPASIITHQKWEQHAAGKYQQELEELTRKIAATFSIDSCINKIKIKTPEKVEQSTNISSYSISNTRKVPRTLFFKTDTAAAKQEVDTPDRPNTNNLSPG